MQCHKVREQLDEYLNGSLAPRQRRAIEDHLGQCEACRKELESFKTLDSRLRREIPLLWERVNPSPVFEARLKRAIFSAPERPSRVTDRLRLLWQNHQRALATGIAACVILALAISLPLTLTSGGAGPEMIAQDTSGQMTATSRYPAESEEPTLKMAIPAAPESIPAGMPVPPPTAPQAETINGDITLSGTYGLAMEESAAALPGKELTFSEDMILAKEQELALWIAFSDPGVKEILKEKTLVAIEVQGVTVFGELECPGPTVVLSLQNPDATKTILHACVNLATHRVSGVSVASE